MARATMQQFAVQLSNSGLDLPVFDKTGLAGHYDITLNWIPSTPALQHPTQTASTFSRPFKSSSASSLNRKRLRSRFS